MNLTIYDEQAWEIQTLLNYVNSFIRIFNYMFVYIFIFRTVTVREKFRCNPQLNVKECLFLYK